MRAGRLISAVVTKPGPTAKERSSRYAARIELNISLSAANGSSSSMSRILDLMSQSTVVSYPQVLEQLSSENSEKAKYSQVNVILIQWLKQVMSLVYAH